MKRQLLKLQHTQDGMSVVEVLLAGSILLIMATAASGSLFYSQESAKLAGNKTQATLLAEEGIEAVRNLRDNAWSNLNDGTYGLNISGGQWVLSGSQDVNGLFTRQITIASTGSNRKDITAQVNWQQNPQRSGTVSLTTRLTNWLRSSAVSWANAARVGGYNNTGSQDGLKLQAQGNYLYVVTAGSPDFVILDITDPATPTLVGSMALGGTPTNIAVSGNYAYITSDSNAQELQIINITNPAAPAQVGSYNAPGNADGLGVFVSGTTVYFVRVFSTDNNFFVINAANPAAPTLTGSLQLNAQGNEVSVTDSYAYVASASDTQELQVVNLTTPSTPTIVGSLNLTGTVDSLTVTSISGTVALGTAGGNLVLVNITAPAAPTLISTFAAGGSVNDIVFGNSNKYIFAATSAASAEFKVINVEAPSSPALVGSASPGGVLNGVAYHSSQDRAYVVGSNNNEEVTSLAPQ